MYEIGGQSQQCDDDWGVGWYKVGLKTSKYEIGGNDKDNFDDIDDLDEEDNPGEERRLTEIDNQVHKTQGGSKLGLEGNMFNTCMRYVVSHNKV
jgi:hypothetical protein